MSIEGIISEIDTAVGLLIMPATREPLVKQAMDKLMQVSLDLGEIGELLESEAKDE